MKNIPKKIKPRSTYTNNRTILTGMTVLHPTDEDNISDEGIIHDEVIRNNEESHRH